MPQKTKKQKMAAEKRKHHHIQDPSRVAFIEKNEPIPVEKKRVNSSLLITDQSTLVFKKELSKSLIISAIIILVEIAIYLAQNKVIPFIN